MCLLSTSRDTKIPVEATSAQYETDVPPEPQIDLKPRESKGGKGRQEWQKRK